MAIGYMRQAVACASRGELDQRVIRLYSALKRREITYVGEFRTFEQELRRSPRTEAENAVINRLERR
jgi:hypothetical protein